MAAHVPMGHPCGECDSCSFPKRTLESHPAFFEAITKSHTDGIDFKIRHFTTNQIADAFANLIPGHMDWPIKKSALERWNALLPALLEGPKIRESKFDLQTIYHLLDDFLFLKALQDLCAVEWVGDMLEGFGRRKIGWVIRETNIRGPRMRIRMVRPSPEIPRTVHNVLCVLMHEMCHALLFLACECSVCDCELNMMNGWGITGHGPAWQRVRAAVQETSNLYLNGFSEPFLLSRASEPDLRLEAKARLRMLEGLYKKVAKKENDFEQEKKGERKGKRVTEKINTMENDQRKADYDETLACVVAMFEEWEELAGSIIEKENSESG